MSKHTKVRTVRHDRLHGCRVVRTVATAAERVPRPVGDVEALIAGVEVVASVVSEEHGVQAVIVVDTAPSGQQRLPRDDAVVLVLRVHEQIRRLRDDDLVTEHRDSERREHFGTLVEYLSRVGLTVAVGILQDHDAIPGKVVLGLALQIAAVVHRLDKPHTPALVDIEVGRIHEQGLAGPQGHFETWRDLELVTNRGRRHGARSQRERNRA